VSSFTGNLDIRRLNLMFILMVLVSIVIGVLAGSQSRIDIKMMFYIIVFANVMVLAYLVFLRDMTVAILLYFYTLVFLNLYWRIPLPGTLPDLDLPRLIFVFFWAVFLLEIAMGTRRLLPRTAAETAMLITAVVVMVSLIYYRVPRIRIMLNGFAIPYAMFMLSKHIFADAKSVKRLLYWGAVPLSVYFPMNHLFERFGPHQLVFPRYIVSREIGEALEWTGQRTIGAFLQPVATGFAIVCMFLLSLYALSKLRGFLPRLLSVFITLVTPVSIFVIYTRSVYLGFFNALAVLAIFSRRLRKYAIVIMILAAVAVIINWDNVTTENREKGGLATEETAAGRLVIFQASLRMFLDHPFTGVGFFQYDQYSLRYVRQVRSTLLGMRQSWVGKNVKQHNQLLLMLTELGLVGFVPLCLMYYFIIRMLWKARRVHSDAFDDEFVVVVWAVFAEYFTNIMFMNPTFFEFMNVMPMVLAGIVVGGYQRATLGLANNNNSERRHP
jgi:O-antigen ligase